MFNFAKLAVAAVIAVSGATIGIAGIGNAYANESCQMVCIKVAAWRCVEHRMECVETGQNTFENAASAGDDKTSGGGLGVLGQHLHHK